jgi:hypothetical protein
VKLGQILSSQAADASPATSVPPKVWRLRSGSTGSHHRRCSERFSARIVSNLPATPRVSSDVSLSAWKSELHHRMSDRVTTRSSGSPEATCFVSSFSMRSPRPDNPSCIQCHTLRKAEQLRHPSSCNEVIALKLSATDTIRSVLRASTLHRL